jgi:predicted thioesterase
MTRAAVAAFVVLVDSSLAFAQGKPAKVVVDRRPAIVADFVVAARGAQAAKVPTPFVVQLGAGNRQRMAAYLMAAHADRAAYGALLKALEAARVDKQVGSPPTANGATSIAMKGLAPRILGLAVERGALTREVSGTNLTFRVSPVGAFKALQGAGLVDLNDDYLRDKAQRLAGRLSLAATFDVSRGTSAGVFAGNDQQLASWAARYTFINRRDPAAPEYADRWRELLSDDTAPYRESVATLNDALGRWAAYAGWEAELVGAVETTVEAPFKANQDFEAGVKTFTTLLIDRLKRLETLPMPAEVTSALNGYATTLSLVQTSIEKIYAFAGKGPLVTGDWTTTRDIGLPDLFVWTGVFEVGLGRSRKTDFTFNGSVSKYRSMPTGQTHSLKSVELTAQLEHPLGKALPAPTLTFAGRYSYLPNDTVASTGAVIPASPAATIAAAPQGHIAFLQVKLTIPVKDSGMKVPISITTSNRTELIKEKDVRGSIGLTLDLDTLMSFVSGARP